MKNYRLLNVGEEILTGDEWWNQSFLDSELGQWNIHKSRVGDVVTKNDKPIRRDMDKWPDGVPPIGTRVSGPFYERGIVIDHTDTGTCFVYCILARAEGVYKYEDLKPWRN